jgi:hypothetical protein
MVSMPVRDLSETVKNAGLGLDSAAMWRFASEWMSRCI